MSNPGNFETVEKIPPHSLEAEMSLLGALLIDKDSMMKVADIIAPEDFYKSSHGKIYEAMQELYTKNESIDLLTVDNRLREKNQLDDIGGKTYLATLCNIVPTAANVVHYAQIVHRKAVRRRLIHSSYDIAKLGYEEREDLEQVLDEAQRSLFGVAGNYFRQNFTHIRGVLDTAFDRIDELHKNKGQLRGYATGFKELDNILAGLQKSDLVIIAARPSVGKTAFAMDLVRHIGAKLKIPIGMFSLEMSKEQLVDRMLCAEANIDLWRLRSGKLSDKPEDDDFPRIGHAIGTLSEAPIYIDDSPNNNILQLRTKARRLQAEHNVGMIVIDYLQLMESRGNSENRVQEVSEITRGLKGIARELNIPVIALSQLSRVVEQSKPAIPKLSHLRESGSIEQDADIVMFIYRKSADRNYRPEEISPDERYMAEIHIAKHRNGPTGLVRLSFNENYTSFRNLETRVVHENKPLNPGSIPPTLRPKSDFTKPISNEPPTPQF
ncbi:MAG: replicative DNA helicase [Candidatus Magasanikbacteria bacterium]|nr:replicative DNA helicase [Candidatus Magasanikbacteria bacterium]